MSKAGVKCVTLPFLRLRAFLILMIMSFCKVWIRQKWPVLEIGRIEKVETMAICCLLYFWVVFQSCNHHFVSHLSGSGFWSGNRNKIPGGKPWQRAALCLLASWPDFFSLFLPLLEICGYGECKQGWRACHSNGKTPWLDSGQRVFKLSRV